VLLGQEVGRDSKVRCPWHGGGQERTPSLHCFPGDNGWYCFGCGKGGSIIDLAAMLYGIDARGAGFHEIRRRLAEELLAAPAVAA
jgi:DNA primase